MRAVTEERRAIDLGPVRADGWFARLGDGSREFRQLCQIVGDRFVAFGVIAGVQIRALTVDRRAPDASLIDFAVAEGEAEQRLPLGEFRRRLATAMLSEEHVLLELPDAPTNDELQAFLGVRTLLLAGLFDVEVRALRVGGGLPIGVAVAASGIEEELTAEDLREALRDRVRGELARVRPQSPFAIDLSRVPEAADALDSGDAARTIELLGAWPGPLSMLLRTAEGAALAPEARTTLAHALGVLGTAYVRTERFDWAEEVLRLGIQWAQDGNAGAELFRRLAEAYVVRERHGEAIGLLRRALVLGEAPGEVLPLLARCFAARGRWVAALVCVEQADVAGVPLEVVAEVRASAEAALGEPWMRLRALVPAPTLSAATAPTLPPKAP
jgi:tetratricopeptide (TPR) repeat protein